MSKTVKVTYNSNTLETVITVDGKEFDTSRINGREIADWAYPFMMRKVKWNGFYEEMVEALDGEKEFNLVFDGPDEALEELKEAWEDAPVHIIEESEISPAVIIEYNADTLTTNITVNGQPFDTSRINGREIEDWVYPFQIRKVKWNGIFEELSVVVDSENFTIEFVGDEKWIDILREECPENITIYLGEKNADKNGMDVGEEVTSDNCILLSGLCAELINIKKDLFSKLCSELIQRRYYIACIDEKFPDLAVARANEIKIKRNENIEIIESVARQLEDSYWYRFSLRSIPYDFGKKYANELRELADKMQKEYPLLSADEFYQEGKKLYDCKEFEQAVYCFNRAADMGNKLSLKSLGECYFYGNGVKKSLSKAYKWYKKASEQISNDADVMYMMGYCYNNSIGVTADLNEAIKWYTKAANVGHKEAKTALQEAQTKLEEESCYKKAVPIQEENKKTESAEELYHQADVCDDEEEAFRLLKKSADLGYAEAQCLIGQFYYLGEIVDEDDEQAYNYFKKAAEQNNAEAQYWMGELYYNGYGVKEDESEAVKWYRKSANNGFADAMLSLGDCYFYGEGVKENIQEAISWYKKGADKGDFGCQYALANCYWNGNGVKENKGLAFSLFEKSAEQGYALANNKLGLIYDEGEYKKADVNKAIEYYQRAADAGLAVAMYNLGVNLYIEMNDVDNAIEWLEKALEAGHENAQEMLDRIENETSDYDSFDDEKGTEYYQKASDLRERDYEERWKDYDEDFEMCDDNEESIDYNEGICKDFEEDFEEDFEKDRCLMLEENEIITEEEFLRVMATFIKPDCLEKIIDFFKRYTSAKIDEYNKLEKYIDEFFDLEIEIVDDNDDVSEDIAIDFVSRLKTGMKYNENIITQTLGWFCNSVLKQIINRNEKEFQNEMLYLKSVYPKLKNLIEELKKDFDSNCDKILEFIKETDDNSPEESCIIPHALFYYFNSANDKNYNKLNEIKKQDKKTSTASTVGTAVAGGLLSFIPVVGVPLALGAGVGIGHLTGKSTGDKYEMEFRKFSNKVRDFFYHFSIVYIMWLVSDKILDELKSEAEEEAGLNSSDLDFYNKDNFFDEI